MSIEVSAAQGFIAVAVAVVFFGCFGTRECPSSFVILSASNEVKRAKYVFVYVPTCVCVSSLSLSLSLSLSVCVYVCGVLGVTEFVVRLLAQLTCNGPVRFAGVPVKIKRVQVHTRPSTCDDRQAVRQTQSRCSPSSSSVLPD